MKFRGSRNFIKSSSPNGESEESDMQNELQVSPPALQLKAENEGSASNGDASEAFQLQDSKQEDGKAAAETKTSTEGKEDPKEKFEISKGFMQLGIEGFMDGGRHDVRRPHMPENLAVFKPALAADKTNGDIAKYKKDSNDRFVKKSSGGYIRSAKKSIYDDSAYTATYPEGHVLGTYPNNSGLTIGYGYDLGSRNQADVESRLKSAGFPETDAKSLSEAAGLKGVKAAKITSKLRNTGMMITKEQSLKLLDLTIPEYEDGIDMDKFHPAVVEVMVYLNYWRGAGGAKKYNKAIAEACEGKAESEQIKATRDVVALYAGGDKKTKSWTEQVFSRFGKILGELVEQQDAGKEIVVSENVKTKDQMLAKNDQTGELLKDSVGVKLDDHLAKLRLLTTNVGYGAPNAKSDVEKVMARLVINGTITADEFASVMQTLDATTIGDYVKKYQLTYWKGADGLVEVGGGTEQRLIALKAPAKEAPKETPEKTPEKTPGGDKEESNGLEEIYQLYHTSKIDMKELAKMLKPFCNSNPGGVLVIFEKLYWYQKDNLACSIADQSSDNELAEFDSSVLEKMSAELGGKFNTRKRAGNLKAKERIDAVLDIKKTPVAIPEEEEKEEEKVDDQYTIHDKQAIIRDDKGDYKEGKPTITRWTQVALLETKEVIPSGKKNKITIGKVSYTEKGGTIENWTSMSNLYAQFWNPEDHKSEYDKVDEGYSEAMLKVDTEATRAAKISSGAGVMAVVDQFYPNSTEVADLGSTFGGKLQEFIDFLGENDMSASITAGLRHPLRSLIFDSAIKAAKGGNNLQIAQAQSIKYGMPVDWIHYKTDGTIDEAESIKQAIVVKGEFGIGSTASRGVKDELGGRFSNHNFGNAADMKITFGFKEKSIEKNGTTYTINKGKETPTKTKSGSYYLKNSGSTSLAKLAKKEFGVTRNLDDDAIHWSATGG